MEYNDVVLRPTKIIPPSGGAITETIYADTPNQISVKTRTQIDSNNWSKTIVYGDGMGRTIKSEAVDSNGDVFAEKEYDVAGRVKRGTNPYRIGDSKQWTTTSYDDAGRVKEVIAPDGTSAQTEYDISTVTNFIGTVVTGTDQAGKKIRSITNGLGQLVRVDEPDDSGNLGTLASPA